MKHSTNWGRLWCRADLNPRNSGKLNWGDQAVCLGFGKHKMRIKSVLFVSSSDFYYKMKKKEEKKALNFRQFSIHKSCNRYNTFKRSLLHFMILSRKTCFKVFAPPFDSGWGKGRQRQDQAECKFCLHQPNWTKHVLAQSC